jgi:hypothetical protein
LYYDNRLDESRKKCKILSVMNTHRHTLIRISKIAASFAISLLASCGDYSSTTPFTSQQDVSRVSGYPSLSGKPALRTPAAIGIMTTSRTDSLDFSDAGKKLQAEGSIRSMQSIQSFVSNNDYYQIQDVLAKRAKLLHDTKFLGLDVILICDQMTETADNASLVKAATLGILDLDLKKQNTQLTVLCMDARTGYIYGTMGQQEDGRASTVSIFDQNVFGDKKRSHLVRTTRRDAVQQFPEFWNQVTAKYRK